MKAVVATKYGPPDVLELREMPKPSPGDDEVLIKIHTSTVTAGDCELRRFDVTPLFWVPARLYMGVLKPRKNILGQECAGEIEEVGREVTRFREGDQVFCPTDIALGAHAEYICIPSDYAITTKPSNLTYVEAAAVPTGGLNALHFLQKADLAAGEKILINGAAGTIGSYAVQLAKHFKGEVTAVDSTEKLGVLRRIGADHVIDYTQEDFTETQEKYDIVFDVVGTLSLSRSLNCLERDGRFVSANPSVRLMLQRTWKSLSSSKRVITGVASYHSEDLVHLKELIEDGELQPVIDRRYPLERIQEAHRYVETGNKTGNVVITVTQ